MYGTDVQNHAVSGWLCTSTSSAPEAGPLFREDEIRVVTTDLMMSLNLPTSITLTLHTLGSSSWVTLLAFLPSATHTSTAQLAASPMQRHRRNATSSRGTRTRLWMCVRRVTDWFPW